MEIAPSVVFIFGTPCVGKSTVINELANQGYQSVKVDTLITGFVAQPCKADFHRLSSDITNKIYELCLQSKCKLAIEMGCLIDRDASNLLLEKLGKKAVCIHLSLPIEEAKARARKRNLAIQAGQNESIIIDEPDKIGEFYVLMEQNLPSQYTTIDCCQFSTIRCLTEKIMKTISTKGHTDE
ncbi:AAA family ATPase [Catenovulum sp. SM1970]|uniref:AAA family ATPase n=1 Tax=Marinifaba aquimaris TaxID=2741323 RepID=UPI0015749490|nr:AAA family ATPase [Marinifaba aquimaris]NTS77494.1 AAA family ATPase [Marinifaba aquimaris]